jgi:ABC-type transport system substrate-binding protein
VLGWALGYNYDQYQLWHSSQSKPGRLNFCSYSNPQVDKLLVLARSEFDRDRVRQYCREIQRLIYEDQPYMFLYVPKGVTALHKGVFQVLRPDGRGGWADEPIRATKAGIGIYDTWWRRTAFMPTQPRLPAGGQVKHSP